jgi:flagellar hook-basal body complex protein FliE
MATPLAAANAYSALAKIADRAAGGVRPDKSGSPAPDFSAVLKNALGSVVEAGRNADGQTQALAAGKANIVDVVTAVSETEVALQTLVSVRDRVIQSYEEILRMPI